LSVQQFEDLHRRQILPSEIPVNRLLRGRVDVFLEPSFHGDIAGQAGERIPMRKQISKPGAVMKPCGNESSRKSPSLLVQIPFSVLSQGQAITLVDHLTPLIFEVFQASFKALNRTFKIPRNPLATDLL
jgi:hypothetical protein